MEKRKIYLICWLVASIMLLLGFLIGMPGVIGNLTILAIGISIFPYFFFHYQEVVRIKEMEEKFPIFLRDLVESIRSGVPLHKAIIDLSRINYGRYLTQEIKKIANQLSWKMSMRKVFDLFISRLKKSKKLQSAVTIVKEAYFAGGDLASIIDSVADSTSLLSGCDKERKSVLNKYVIGMYAVSIIFLGVVIAINNFLLPLFSESEEFEELQIANPCEVARDKFSRSVCSLYDIIGRSVLRVEKGYYLPFFFLMALVQAFFAGIIIGQVSEKSFIGGMKHSLILVGIVWGTFLILLQVGMIG